MAYIYKIINDINQKIYIGKTEFSVEKRFKEHCRDAFRERNEKRPLYAAMRKYGVENFHIELIEKTDNPEEREIFWIEYYGSFKNGYNATKGGDGKPYLDYSLINTLFNQGMTCQDIHKVTGYDVQSISRILKSNGITIKDFKEQAFAKKARPVAQIDKDTNKIIKIYPSIREAEKATGNSQHIASVCRGSRKTCKGYKWKYLD